MSSAKTFKRTFSLLQLFFLFISLLFISCSQNQQANNPDTDTTKVATVATETSRLDTSKFYDETMKDVPVSPSIQKKGEFLVKKGDNLSLMAVANNGAIAYYYFVDKNGKPNGSTVTPNFPIMEHPDDPKDPGGGTAGCLLCQQYKDGTMTCIPCTCPGDGGPIRPTGPPPPVKEQ